MPGSICVSRVRYAGYGRRLTCAVPGYYSQCWVATSTIVKRRWHVLRMLSGAIPSTWALAFNKLASDLAMFGVVRFWRNDRLELKAFLQSRHSPRRHYSIDDEQDYDHELSDPPKQRWRIGPLDEPRSRLHHARAALCRHGLAAKPRRCVWALDAGTARIGGKPSQTGWCRKTTMKHHTTAEERQLVGVTHEYADTYSITTHFRLQTRPFSSS